MKPIHELWHYRALGTSNDTNKTPGHTTNHPKRTDTMSGVLASRPKDSARTGLPLKRARLNLTQHSVVQMRQLGSTNGRVCEGTEAETWNNG